MSDDEPKTSEQPDKLKAEIAVELYKAFERLGAKSDLLEIVGSYGDTQPDSWILEQLRRYNAWILEQLRRYNAWSGE